MVPGLVGSASTLGSSVTERCGTRALAIPLPAMSRPLRDLPLASYRRRIDLRPWSLLELYLAILA
jgi:hypothetical protein